LPTLHLMHRLMHRLMHHLKCRVGKAQRAHQYASTAGYFMHK
jgi:hypothetical protein